MMNKTVVLLIVLMAVIGLSGIAVAQIPRNMHKDKCNSEQGGATQVYFSQNGNKQGSEKGKCDDNKDKDEHKCSNDFSPSGNRQGGEKGKCDNKKDENNCNNMPGVAQNQIAQSNRVCGHL